MSAGDNLAFPLVERRRPREEIDRRLREVAAKLRIAHVLEKRPGLLSGGERQRVAIGRALIRDAVGYLMDDPISALDARLREEMRVELKRLQREIGHTLIYVTHDQEEAMSIADRMAILDDGAVRQVAAPQTVYEQPSCRYVAALVGSPAMNFIKGTLNNGIFAAETPPWSQLVAAGSSYDGETLEAGFRPEAVNVVAPGARAALEGTVVSIEPLGAATVIVTNCGGTVVKAMVTGQPARVLGERVGLAPSEADLAFFHAATGERLPLAAGPSN
jgi:multiple sugar transport system ATP-binding protein